MKKPVAVLKQEGAEIGVTPGGGSSPLQVMVPSGKRPTIEDLYHQFRGTGKFAPDAPGGPVERGAMPKTRALASVAGKGLAALGAGLSAADNLASASRSGSLGSVISTPVTAGATYATLDPSGSLNPYAAADPKDAEEQVEEKVVQEDSHPNLTPEASNAAQAAASATPVNHDNILQTAVQGGQATTPPPQPAAPVASAPAAPAAAAPSPATPAPVLPVTSTPPSSTLTPEQAAAAAKAGFTTLYDQRFSNQSTPPSYPSYPDGPISDEEMNRIFAPQPVKEARRTLGKYSEELPPGMVFSPEQAAAAVQEKANVLGIDDSYQDPITNEITFGPASEIPVDPKFSKRRKARDIFDKSFVSAFMNVYSDVLKDMTPHEVGHFASQVFLKMR
tara:strand:+ start:4246 stop:5415 length:1170 start_codon:yes stop_codon:yes gene_type:complete